MELYLRVRLAVSEGMSRRQAAKHFNISRDSVAKMVAYSTPPGYQRQLPIRRPKLDAFVSTIEHWFDEDLKVPRKQRHTAKRVFDRLRDECGFTGGYTIIKDYMRERDQRRQEVFVPLSHPPGHAQADFGEATVVIGGVEQKARFFVLDLPLSDGCYVRAYPAAVAEAWVDGHIHAFAFFGAVPQSIVYDNDRCLVAKILPDGTRKRAALFSGFLSHYLIRDRYGRPGKGNDKGNVEGLVGYARRNFMVPIPQFATWDAFNTFLEATESIDHVGYLFRLAEREMIERHRRKVERRIKAAKFPVVKSLDSFDFAAIPKLNKMQVLELSRCEWIERRENVIALGPSGTGKTHVALGLGLAACQKGLSVGFTTAAALVSEMMEARDERRLLRFQKQMAAYTLLIIDELGFVPLSKTGAELLFELISQRYERGATLITSNLPFDEWTETLGSERLTGALLDRITHHVNILEMNGDSYRLAQSRAKKAG